MRGLTVIGGLIAVTQAGPVARAAWQASQADAVVYLGDDITDEDAFEALAGRGVGILVGDAADPELAGRGTAADYLLASPKEVERFLGGLAREDG